MLFLLVLSLVQRLTNKLCFTIQVNVFTRELPTRFCFPYETKITCLRSDLT